MKRYVAALVVVLLMAAGAGLSWQAIAKRQAQLASQGQSERGLYYEVSDRARARFEVPSRGAKLRLTTISQMALPVTTESKVAWGYTLDLRVGANVFWTKEIAFESRQSRVVDARGAVTHRSTMGAADEQWADFRELWFDLPAAPAGLDGLDGKVELTVSLASHAMAPRRTGIRLFMDDRVLAADGAGREADWALGYLDAGSVSEAARLPRHHWVRLPALGDAQRDYVPLRAMVSDFRTEPVEGEVAQPGAMIDAAHWVAYNVMGPTMLVLHAEGPQVHCELRGAAPGAATPRVEAGAAMLAVAPGPATLACNASDKQPSQLTVFGAPTAALRHANSRNELPSWFGGTASVLRPDIVRIPLELVDATHHAALVVTGARNTRSQAIGQLVRVDARILLAERKPLEGRAMFEAPAPPHAVSLTALPARLASGVGTPTKPASQLELATLTVRYLDAQARLLGSERVPIFAPPAPFETVEAQAGRYDVAEPVSFQVLAPSQAARIEVAADRAVAMRWYRLAGEENVPIEPFRTLTPSAHTWHYVEMDERRWHPFFAESYRDAMASQRAVTLAAQVRLEPQDDDEALADHADRHEVLALTSLPPIGARAQQRIREPIAPKALEATLASWPAHAIYRLVPAKPTKVDFRAMPDAPRISWLVSAKLLGTTMVAMLGERVVHEWVVTQTAGVVDLPNAPTGEALLTINAAQGAEIWIDRPPVVGKPLPYRDVAAVRTVWQLGDMPLRVPVLKPTGKAVRVFIIAYAPSLAGDPHAQIKIAIGGGHPKLQGGIVDRPTVPLRTVTLPPAKYEEPAHLVDVVGQKAGYPRVIGLALLDDLVPGTHEVSVWGPSNVWIRVVATTGRATQPGGPVIWRK